MTTCPQCGAEAVSAEEYDEAFGKYTNLFVCPRRWTLCPTFAFWKDRWREEAELL